MAKNFSEEDLSKMGLQRNPDGSYSKKKTVPQPREIPMPESKKKDNLIVYDTSQSFRTLKITLFGIPMAKQSVRSTNTGHHFQPKKTVDRKKDYIKQILEQLPEGFKPFEKEVHITKFHCVYPPLKYFHKIKGRMEAIRNGEIIYKNTQPDLIDNLKKLAFDSMAKIVLANDGLIVTENDTAKYYGIGGCIIIEMKGY